MYGNPSDLLKAILNYKLVCAIAIGFQGAGRIQYMLLQQTIKKE
jgi:hypothetical protein